MMSKMKRLGRRGGLLGGPARARSLTSSRRVAIAKKAASSRWVKPILVLDRLFRNHGELVSFVANFGARGSQEMAFALDLEEIVLCAVEASRKDSALARMLPVFLWRIRDKLDLKKLKTKAAEKNLAPFLGFFLETTVLISGFRGFDLIVSSLREHSLLKCEYLFLNTASSFLESAVARDRTPENALAWGVLSGTPLDSFESYYQKVFAL